MRESQIKEEPDKNAHCFTGEDTGYTEKIWLLASEYDCCKIGENFLYQTPEKNRLLWFLRVLLIVVWVTIIVFFVLHRKDLTPSAVIEFTPANPLLAAIVMLLLFALKSVSIVIYSGILYTANGLLFPLPLAIMLNVLGTAIMVTIPYLFGRRSGASAARHIISKYPKAEQFNEFRKKNDFLFVLLVRLVRLLPYDVVSLYMGAVSIEYKKYLLGSLLGILPSTITFAAMGMGIADNRSLQFVIALFIELLCVAVSVLIYRRKRELK